MKGKLEFNLPEEQSEFEAAVKSLDWKYSVLEIDQFLRNKLKHGHEYKTPDEALEETRKQLRNLILDNNLNLDYSC
jgi:hypothetical protein